MSQIAIFPFISRPAKNIHPINSKSSGPSLKDLGITKWGIVAKIGDITKKVEIERKFDELWKSSKPLDGDK